MKIKELFAPLTKADISHYPNILKNEWEIMEYVDENSDEALSDSEQENLIDRLRGTTAELKLLPIDSLKTIGNVSELPKNHKSIKKINKYSKLNSKTIPPIVVDSDLVIDGNHRLVAAKKMGLKEIYAYVINDNINENVKREDGLKYQLEVTDHHKGENFGYVILWDEKTDKKIGYIDWSEYDNKVWIKMIEVAPEYRRKGFGTKLMNYLKDYFDGKEIILSPSSEDGAKFFNKINESGRLFSGVRLDEIPAQYKNLKVLGRGTTAIALEKDANTVLIFTRDAMKRDWLIQSWGLEIAQEIGSYESNKHHIRGVREMPIYILEMMKLYPLDSKNKKVVYNLMKEFDNIRRNLSIDHSHPKYRDALVQQYLGVFEDYETKFEDDHQLKKFIEFIQNYNQNQYTLDLGPRNFKQTADGKLVVLDPIADRQLLQLYFSRNMPSNQ